MKLAFDSGPADPFEVINRLLRLHPLVLILDGLEVHQEAPGEIGLIFDDQKATEPSPLAPNELSGVGGRLKEPRLRNLLRNACQGQWKGLIVVVSRYPLIDLSCHLGSSLREIEGDRLKLTEDEGSRLLEACGITEVGREAGRYQ